jgi:hypothetical protein
MLPQKLSRRRFIAGSTAAASGLLLSGPFSARAANPRRVSPNEKLNIGIIGAWRQRRGEHQRRCERKHCRYL